MEGKKLGIECPKIYEYSCSSIFFSLIECFYVHYAVLLISKSTYIPVQFFGLQWE